MEYQEIIYLLGNEIVVDETGNNIPSTTSSKKCYAKKQSIRTNEFYNATMNGLTPSCEFVIKRLNYNCESEIEYNNEIYSVIRTVDPKNKFDIVLVCAKKIGIDRVETSE